MGFLSDLLDDIVEIPGKIVDLGGEVIKVPKKVINKVDETLEELFEE